MTTITNVTNGSTTNNVDTSDMNIAEYNIQLDYQANNTYNSRNAQCKLNVKDGNVHSIGIGTDTPWSKDIVSPGDIDQGKRAMCNYTSTPMFMYAVPFTGDFTMTLHIGVDYMGAYGNFGFTTDIHQISAEIRVYNTSINNTQTIAPVFNAKNRTETVTFTRIGNTYTYAQNGNTYTTTVTNPSTVYLYVQKNGNGSIYIETVTYQNL